MNDGQANDFQKFRHLLKRMSMKTSARNQLAGHIVGLHEGQVDFEMCIKIDDEKKLSPSSPVSQPKRLDY